MLTSTKYIVLVHLDFLHRYIFSIFSLDLVCMINQQDICSQQVAFFYTILLYYFKSNPVFGAAATQAPSSGGGAYLRPACATFENFAFFCLTCESTKQKMSAKQGAFTNYVDKTRQVGASGNVNGMQIFPCNSKGIPLLISTSGRQVVKNG